MAQVIGLSTTSLPRGTTTSSPRAHPTTARARITDSISHLALNPATTRGTYGSPPGALFVPVRRPVSALGGRSGPPRTPQIGPTKQQRTNGSVPGARRERGRDIATASKDPKGPGAAQAGYWALSAGARGMSTRIGKHRLLLQSLNTSLSWMAMSNSA